MKKKGSILVIILWIISILAIFGIGLSRISWSGYYFARWRENNSFALPAVNAVLLMTKFNRIEDETLMYDILSEFSEEREYDSGTIKVKYTVTDEERKININKASSLMLKDMPDMNMNKAVAIVNSEYKPFFPKEELLLVDEIDEEDYTEIKDLITIYGEGYVNINTCDGEILGVLGMEDGLIEKIMEFRQGEDGELNTDDDGKFKTALGISSALKEEMYLNLREEQMLAVMLSKNLLGVKSNYYRIAADVFVNEKLVNKFSIVIGRDKRSRKYLVKEWQQF